MPHPAATAVHTVDVLRRRHEAEDERSLATPAPARGAPGPPRRVLGDPPDRARVPRGLRPVDA